MNKRVMSQITIFILITSGLSGMLIGTDIYKEVQHGIVEVLCLSCLKLDPKTTREFTFDTVNNEPHPEYVLDNLSSGIVFLHYSEDACPGCDIMYPVVQNLLNVQFGKKDVFSTQIEYHDHKITYYYTNIDYATSSRVEPFETYDVQDVNGLPMFTIVTLGYYSGIIKPKFVTLYGTLGVDTDEQRTQLLEDIIEDAFTLWDENNPGYEP
jgi:hypothetical protein